MVSGHDTPPEHVLIISDQMVTMAPWSSSCLQHKIMINWQYIFMLKLEDTEDNSKYCSS